MTHMNLHSSLIVSSRGFEALQEEWDELYLDCPAATPFQTWAWLFSWWESYGGDYELRLTTIRDESGRLVGILPFMITRRFVSLKILSMMGTGITDCLDVLVKDGCEETVYDAGARALLSLEGWNVGDFRQLRANSHFSSLLEYLPLSRISLAEEGYPKIIASSWEEALLNSNSKNLRKMARRAVKRSVSDGSVTVSLTKNNTVAEIEAAAHCLVELHRDYWRGRNIAVEHLEDSFETHLVSAASRMVRTGAMEIRQFIMDENVFASQIFLKRDKYIGQLIFGARSDAINRYQLSSLFIHDGFEMIKDLDTNQLDLLRGEEDYKLRWRPVIVPGTRVVLGGNALIRSIYGFLVGSYAALKPYWLSAEAPIAIKVGISTLKALRLRIVSARSKG